WGRSPGSAPATIIIFSEIWVMWVIWDDEKDGNRRGKTGADRFVQTEGPELEITGLIIIYLSGKNRPPNAKRASV
ncbi:MAG: hypothetical protein AB1405_11125, partial [Bdellovibrionota bacterium]